MRRHASVHGAVYVLLSLEILSYVFVINFLKLCAGRFGELYRTRIFDGGIDAPGFFTP